jgi:benzoyl-CoA reductase/2-hydroxyglutaryl-CoA dehydratase subunit BcrC/BadD/HgdB
VRNSFELALKGKYEFFDGVVVPHSCDNVQRMDVYWQHYVGIKPPRLLYLNVPHVVSLGALSFFKTELKRFKEGLETITGQKIAEEALRRSVRLHNHTRNLLRKISELRKQIPPLVSGVEMMQITIAGTRTPVEEYNGLLEMALNEVVARPKGPPKINARLLVTGSQIDDVYFFRLVEGSGANIVIDDLCTGTKQFAHDVDLTDDLLDGLATYYLDKITCPRTHRDNLEARFGHITRFAREFKVNGVIVSAMTFCDTVELDVPDLRDYLQKEGLPVLVLEDDYTMAGSGRIKTKVQAFLEMISEGDSNVR